MLPEPVRLVQRTGFRKQLTLEIRQDELYCVQERGGETFRWHCPLGQLDENPMERWSRRRGGLFIGIILFVIAAVILIVGAIGAQQNHDRGEVRSSGLVAAIILAPAIALLVSSWRRIRRHVGLLLRDDVLHGNYALRVVELDWGQEVPGSNPGRSMGRCPGRNANSQQIPEQIKSRRAKI